MWGVEGAIRYLWYRSAVDSYPGLNFRASSADELFADPISWIRVSALAETYGEYLEATYGNQSKRQAPKEKEEGGREKKKAKTEEKKEEKKTPQGSKGNKSGYNASDPVFVANCKKWNLDPSKACWQEYSGQGQCHRAAKGLPCKFTHATQQ